MAIPNCASVPGSFGELFDVNGLVEHVGDHEANCSIGDGCSHVWDAVEVLSGSVRFADEALDATGIAAGLADDPTVEAIDNPGLSAVAKNRIDKSGFFRSNLDFVEAGMVEAADASAAA